MDAQDTRFCGWVLLEDGKIAAMGEGVPPACADVLDGEGGVLTPGLIDIHSHLGLYEDGLGFEGADGNEDTDPVTPHLRAIDGINPMDRGFQEAREAGVTAVAVSPAFFNLIGGQIALIKTAGRRWTTWWLRRRSPSSSRSARTPIGLSPSGRRRQSPAWRLYALIRERLYKAKEYFARKARAEDDPDQDDPDYDSKLEALLPLLWGKAEAHFHAHRADDIFTALRIAKEFGLRAVIIHGTEAHLVADLLAEEQVPVVSGPFMTDRSKPELRHLTDESPALLCRAGIPTAITVDHPEIPLRLLPMALMLAVRAGMGKTDALRAVTSVPAQIAGMENRIGSLRTGLDADCVLWSGDPLDMASQVQAVCKRHWNTRRPR